MIASILTAGCKLPRAEAMVRSAFWRPVRVLLAAAVAVFGAALSASAAPQITITELPPYGEFGEMKGLVTGVGNVSDYRVAPYIQIEGAGWWTKPTFAEPTVAINTDGSFAAPVTSGGLDNYATIFCAALVQATATPPPAEGARRVPADLASVAIVYQERYGRTVSFAGRTWAVKEAPLAAGPGGNLFSSRAGDVWVDPDGLHLKIQQYQGQWYSTEVFLLDRLGYGTYTFQTRSRLDTLDVNATFGAFTWDAYGDDEASGLSHHREIDFEDSRWGQALSSTNAQMVVQPSDVLGNLRQYTIPDLSSNAALTRFFTWTPGQIEFVALRGHRWPTSYSAQDLIDQWTYSKAPGENHFVPEPEREGFRFNLWLNNVAVGGPPPPVPAAGEPIEVLITGFSFTAAANDWKLAGGGNWGEPARWTAGSVPDSKVAWANLGSNLAASGSVDLQTADRTVKVLSFGNAMASYTVASGGGRLILAADSGPATVEFAGDNGRDHAISAPIVLQAATTDFNLGTHTLTLTGAQDWSGHGVVLHAGTLKYEVTTPPLGTAGATLAIEPGATVELAGSQSALSDGTHHVDVTNTEGGVLLVSGTQQQVGSIIGSGSTQVAEAADLTASYIRQHSLVLQGTEGHPAMVRIRPSGGDRALLLDRGDRATVPEPRALWLLAVAAAGLYLCARRQRRLQDSCRKIEYIGGCRARRGSHDPAAR